MRPALAVVLLAILVGLIACGDGSDDDGGTTTEAESSPNTATTTAEQGTPEEESPQNTTEDETTEQASDDSAPTEEDVIEALGLQDQGNGFYSSATPGCEVEEIVIGEEQIAQYVDFAPDTMATNDDGTVGVQFPDTNAETCQAEFESALNDI